MSKIQWKQPPPKTRIDWPSIDGLCDIYARHIGDGPAS